MPYFGPINVGDWLVDDRVDRLFEVLRIEIESGDVDRAKAFVLHHSYFPVEKKGDTWHLSPFYAEGYSLLSPVEVAKRKL